MAFWNRTKEPTSLLRARILVNGREATVTRVDYNFPDDTLTFTVEGAERFARRHHIDRNM